MKQRTASCPSRAALLLATAALMSASLAGCGHRRSSYPRPIDGAADVTLPPPAMAGPAELALLSPLVVGGPLEDWTVERIEAVHEGNLQLRVAHGSQHLDLNVSLLNPSAPPPPGAAGRYAIYYSTRVVSLYPDGVRLAAALGTVLARNLAVPVPPGMAPFPGAAVDAH